jgi:hypothetical protein
MPRNARPKFHASSAYARRKRVDPRLAENIMKLNPRPMATGAKTLMLDTTGVTDSNRRARLNVMRDILHCLHYAGRSKKLAAPDRNMPFEFTSGCLACNDWYPEP